MPSGPSKIRSSQSRVMTQAHGMSLVEVLISLAITGVVLMTMTSMHAFQAKENQAVSEKLAAMDASRLITATLSNPGACASIFGTSNLVSSSSMPYDSTSASPTSPVFIPVHALPSGSAGPDIMQSGAAASPMSKSLMVLASSATPAGLRVAVTGPNTATVEVNFDQSLLVRSIKNLQFPITLQTLGTPTATTITGCTGGANFSSCTTRYPATVNKMVCGVTAQALCLAGETFIGGGGANGSNLALQNSMPVFASGKIIGWETTWYDGADSCNINFFADGTTAPGTSPCFDPPPLGSPKCGSAMVICCL